MCPEPPVTKPYRQEWHHLAEDASLRHYLPEALASVRREVGSLIKLVKDGDTGEASWTMVRAPWTPPGVEEKLEYSPEVSQHECSLGRLNPQSRAPTAPIPHPTPGSG